MIPGDLLAYLHNPVKGVRIKRQRWRKTKAGDWHQLEPLYKKGLTAGGVALIELNSGDWIAARFNGYGERCSIWRVKNEREGLRALRGKTSNGPRRLRFGESPF